MSIATILITAIFVSSSGKLVMDHNFRPNESASFLSVVDQMKSALNSLKSCIPNSYDLVRQNAEYARMILTNDTIKEIKERNSGIAMELLQTLDSLNKLIGHDDVSNNLSKNADTIAEAVIVRIDKDELNDSTIHASAMATDINNILDDYVKAFGKKNMHMDNMSSMSKINEKNSLNVVKDLAAHQRDMALTDIAKDRLNQLKSRLNLTLDLDNLTKAIDQLKKSVQNKEPSVNIMAIVHGHVHQYLQSIFNLEFGQNSNFRTAMKSSTTIEPVINTTTIKVPITSTTNIKSFDHL